MSFGGGEALHPSGPTMLEETSIAGPALLTGPGGPRGLLYLAWTGRDEENHLNIRTSPDGFSNIANSSKRTLGDRSIASPALCLVTQDTTTTPTAIPRTVYLAWTGRDDAHSLNMLTSTNEGMTFGDKSTLQDTSIAGPALANVVLYTGTPSSAGVGIAWTGRDSEHFVNSSVYGGAGFGYHKRTLSGSGSSLTNPALVSYGQWSDTEDRFLLGWTDKNHRLRVLDTPNLADLDLSSSHPDHPVSLPETSIAGPALVGQPVAIATSFGATSTAPYQRVIAWTDIRSHLNVRVMREIDPPQIG
jgi:hypothetical protein